MQVSAVKTHIITQEDKDLFSILNRYLSKLKERSVVAVSSKIVAITQGRMIKMDGENKDKLIAKEAQFYLPREENPYNVSLTITRNMLVASAGIDESNGNGYFVLWPKDVQQVANKVRQHVSKNRRIREIGVIITDSKTTPLRWGVTGFALAYSGFTPLKDYVGTTDLFGRTFAYEKLNIADSLASAAVLAMGEGDEQTPLAVITDLPNIEFVHRNPTEDELRSLQISKEADLYTPLLTGVVWKKGQRT